MISTSIRARLPEKIFLYVAMLASLPLTLIVYWIWSVMLFKAYDEATLVLLPVIEYMSEPIRSIAESTRRSFLYGIAFLAVLSLMISLWLSFYNLMVAHCRHHKVGLERRLWRLALRLPPLTPAAAYIYFFLHYVTDERWTARIAGAIRATTDRFRHHS